MARDATGLTCHTCARPLAGRAAFTLNRPGGERLKCLRCAVRHGPMLKRCVAASLVVGTALVALNQGDRLFTGQWSTALFWKIPLTYLVPFLVSAWGALSNARR